MCKCRELQITATSVVAAKILCLAPERINLLLLSSSSLVSLGRLLTAKGRDNVGYMGFIDPTPGPLAVNR